MCTDFIPYSFGRVNLQSLIRIVRRRAASNQVGATKHMTASLTQPARQPSNTLREEFEKREANFISPYGCLSANTQGRSLPEKACPIRTAFQVDKDRILFSNAFRRLKHKTQVFLNPSGDEYRTRLTHTLEVAQIARTISRAMFLNEDLAEAIALGHDLGHTPFGHGGETMLKEIFSVGYSHQAQS